MPSKRFLRPWRAVALLIVGLICASGWAGPAVALVFDADPAQSALAPSGGTPAPLAGSIRVDVGQLPPSATTTFDVKAASLTSGGYSISLQPIANPGLGVLGASGDFLIPTLFLTVGDGTTTFDLALPDISGVLLGNGPGCLHDYCLETSFEIDTGAGGLLAVNLVAIPEPSTALLLGLALVGAAAARRRAGR